MRKMFFVILIITAISSFYFAQPSSARADETKTFVGTIESFPYGFRFKSGPPLWPFGMIEVAADNGQKNNFLIVGSGPRATIFYDIDGKSLGTVTASLSKTEVGKKVEIGKKVEVTYTTPPETARFINRNLAVSVRYVAADYVLQPTASTTEQAVLNSAPSATAASESGNNIFVGKVLKGGVTFSLRCSYRFVIVTDNGEKKDIWIPRDNMRITDINGNSVYGAPPRAGRKMEIKYSIGDNGQYETVSMRYVP